MWLVYALSAAVLWGVSYAACGKVIERGMAPLSFFFLYALCGAIAGGCALAATGKLAGLGTEIRSIGDSNIWLIVALISSAAGTLLIYMAIGEKNATLASLIEISYPIFVAFFTWLFFREMQLSLSTFAGGALILSGVAVVYLGNSK